VAPNAKGWEYARSTPPSDPPGLRRGSLHMIELEIALRRRRGQLLLQMRVVARRLRAHDFAFASRWSTAQIDWPASARDRASLDALSGACLRAAHGRSYRLPGPLGDQSLGRKRLRRHRTHATKVFEGGWELNGAKAWITNSPRLSAAGVWCRPDRSCRRVGEHRGLQVEADQTGFTASAVRVARRPRHRRCGFRWRNPSPR